MSDQNKPDKPMTDNGINKKNTSDTEASREQKLAKQLRDNLAKRKNQSRARNTKPRKFKKLTD